MPDLEAITPRLLRRIPRVVVGTLVAGRVEVAAVGSLQDESSPTLSCWDKVGWSALDSLPTT